MLRKIGLALIRSTANGWFQELSASELDKIIPHIASEYHPIDWLRELVMLAQEDLKDPSSKSDVMVHHLRSLSKQYLGQIGIPDRIYRATNNAVLVVSQERLRSLAYLELLDLLVQHTQLVRPDDLLEQSIRREMTRALINSIQSLLVDVVVWLTKIYSFAHLVDELVFLTPDHEDVAFAVAQIQSYPDDHSFEQALRDQIAQSEERFRYLQQTIANLTHSR